MKNYSFNPLNPVLYAALESAASRGLRGSPPGLAGRSVKINRPGVQNVYRRRLIFDGRVVEDVDNIGEEYRICCPGCDDTKHRLYINHIWGVDKKNWQLLHCFNEQCETRYGYDLIRDLRERLRTHSIGMAQQIDYTSARAVEEIDPEWPGPMISLGELAPTHHANRYLLGRGYDYQKLSSLFGFHYCISSPMPMAKDRIIIPIYLEGKLRGWQARFVDEDASGSTEGLWLCPTCRIIPDHSGNKLKICPNCGNDHVNEVLKYYSMPGMRTGENLFNFDVARQWPFAVLVEGLLDVIHVGIPLAPEEPGLVIGTFTHHISDAQFRLILEVWGCRPNGTVVLFYDNNAKVKDRLRYMTTLQETYERLRRAIKNVLLVTPPDGRDPGGMPHDLIWKYIVHTSMVNGVRLF